MDECTLDNILVHQKDKLIQLLNTAEKHHCRQTLYDVPKLLDLVKEFWEKCNYGYKIKEIQERFSKIENLFD